MYHIAFIHFFVDEYSGCFHVLAIVHSVTMNIGIHVSCWIMVLSRYVPRSGIAGSFGSSIFNFLGNLHTVCHSGSTNFIPTKSGRRYPFLHTHRSIYYLQFWQWPFWLMWWYLTAVLIWISWIVILRLFSCVFGHLYVFLEKCLFRSSVHFSIGVFLLLLLFF